MEYTRMHVIKWLIGHRDKVSEKLTLIGNDLVVRGRRHDNSYTDDTEMGVFIRMKNAVTQEQKKHFGDVLSSIHGNVNDYIPAYFGETGIKGMHILQLTEYICDKMATYEETHARMGELPSEEYYNYVLEGLGDISDDLVSIVKNTMDYVYNKNLVINRTMKQEEKINYEQKEKQ